MFAAREAVRRSFEGRFGKPDQQAESDEYDGKSEVHFVEGNLIGLPGNHLLEPGQRQLRVALSQ